MSLRWLVVITPRLLFLLLPVFLKDLEALLERTLRLFCPDALGLDALVRKDLRAWVIALVADEDVLWPGYHATNFLLRLPAK